MNIIDIIRGLPMPVQAGILGMVGMGDSQDQTAVAPEAGAGRGFVNPPMANPEAPRPVAPARPAPMVAAMASQPSAVARPDISPDNIDAGGGQNIAMAGPNRTPDNIDAGGGQNIAMQGPAQQPGILSRFASGLDNAIGFSQPDFLNRLGTALAVAGSQDPAKALLQVQQNRAEEAKLREARRRANQPKVDPIAGTPFFQITYPDGRTEVSNNPALADYYKAQSLSKQNAAIEKAVLDDRLARGRDQSKADIKASEEARPLLNDIQGLKGRWEQAKEIVGTQGTMAQVQGMPVISGIAGFFGGDEVSKNKFLEGLTVDETLLNTARTKGAISNQEMNLFKSPIPSVTDDREKVWKPWIEKRLEVLDKLEKFYAGETGRTSAGAGAAAPAAGSMTVPGLSPKASRYFQ